MRVCSDCGTPLWPVTTTVRACPYCDRVDLMPNVAGSDVRPIPRARPYDWQVDGD